MWKFDPVKTCKSLFIGNLFTLFSLLNLNFEKTRIETAKFLCGILCLDYDEYGDFCRRWNSDNFFKKKLFLFKKWVFILALGKYPGDGFTDVISDGCQLLLFIFRFCVTVVSSWIWILYRKSNIAKLPVNFAVNIYFINWACVVKVCCGSLKIVS